MENSPTPVPVQKRGRLLIIIGTLLVVTSILFVLFDFLKNKQNVSTEVVPVPEDIEKFESPTILTELPPGVSLREGVLQNDPTDYSVYYKELKRQPGVEWFIKPVPMEDLGYISEKPGIDYSQYDSSGTGLALNYFQIGTYNSEPIVYLAIPCDGMCFYDDYLMFVGSNAKKVEMLGQHSTYSLSDEYSMYELVNGVTVNNDISLEALQISNISINGTELKSGSNGFRGRVLLDGFFANSQFNSSLEQAYEKMEFVKETEYGPLFKGYDSRFPGTADFIYAIRTVGGFASYFDTEVNYMGDDRVLQITWNDGSINTTMYRSDGLGSCGGGGPEVALDRVADSDLRPVGKTSTGQTVYTIVNENHPLITRVFETTKGIVYDYDEVTGESRTYTITPKDFIAAKGVVIIVDALGDQNIFTNGNLGPQAECGKPVIYLYPEETKTISVKVDALVTKSEPQYAGGWVVEATPEGKLTHKTGSYTSLFWDGYGNGVYPELNEGFVVPTRDALKVMGDHLAYMGFNDTEIYDFKEFWGPHLPATPYTKFSWIQTKEMNELAALSIEPRPKTLFRAFVDFQGVEEMQSVKPQTLEQHERRGYVVTEWGGLLRK